jgi:repressor of nif and glnA expression
MTTLALEQQRFRRGRILRILAESNDQGASTPMVRTLVREWGYKADADTVAIDLAWLAQHGFATLRDVGGIGFARITQAGRDIVSRDLDVPGVAVLED